MPAGFFLGKSMSKPKNRKMVALKVLETSGVDHPAHLEEGWIVMKSQNGGVPMSESIGMEEGLEEAYIERVVELEKALNDSQARVSFLEKEMKGMSYGENDEDEDEEEDEEETMKSLLKSLPEPVRQLLEKAETEANSAREELRKEREATRDREFVAKAADWRHLTLEAKEVGPALRRLADIDFDLFSVIQKTLDGANAQAESAAIFEEIGRGGRPDSGDAYSKVYSLAKAALENGEFSTIEQAISSMVITHPDLYAAYRAESR